MDDMQVRHEPERSRWVLTQGGQLVSVLDYADDGAAVSMTRTFTNQPFRGHGYAARVVEAAVNDAEANGRRVVPMCWYVAEWFDAHPERRDLLA